MPKMNCPICRKKDLRISGEINPKISALGEFGKHIDFELNVFIHISCLRCGYDGKYEAEESQKIPLNFTSTRISKKIHRTVEANFKKGWVFRYHEGSELQLLPEDSLSFRAGQELADNLIKSGQQITHKGFNKHIEEYLESYTAWMDMMRIYESGRKTKHLDLSLLGDLVRWKKIPRKYRP